MTPLYVRPVDATTPWCTLRSRNICSVVTACLVKYTTDLRAPYPDVVAQVEWSTERPELTDQCPACRRHAEVRRRGMRTTRDLKRRAAA